MGQGWVLGSAKACCEAAGSGLVARPFYTEDRSWDILWMQVFMVGGRLLLLPQLGKMLQASTTS